MKIAANQVCTLWTSDSKDKEGSQVFAAPVEFLCRWEDRAQKFQEIAGDERISTTIIYTQDYNLISIGDFVTEGSRNSFLLLNASVAKKQQIATDLSITLAALNVALAADAEIAGLNYLLAIDRTHPLIREVRAKNREKSVNATEQLVKIYCQ